MKHLALKLGIFVILLFSVVIATCLLWTPLKYRRLESKLKSTNLTDYENAIKTLAAEQENAIPHIRRWILSEDDSLIIGSCQALDRMNGKAWQKALPELKLILKGSPSKKTDAAAAVVYNKGYAIDVVASGMMDGGCKWENFPKQKVIRRNICLYVLSQKATYTHKGETFQYQDSLTYELRKYCDKQSVERLISILDNGPEEVRYIAAMALGGIGDNRAISPLTRALGVQDDWDFRKYAARALSHFKEEESVNALIKALDDSHPDVRKAASYALGLIGDAKAVDPLVKLLKDSVFWVRGSAVEALGRIGGKKVLMPLIEQLSDRDIVHRVAKALKNASAMDFGEDQSRWRKWYSERK